MSISFFPIFFLQNLDYTLTLHFYIYKFLFYTMNMVLTDNIIIFYFCHYCYKSKKLECQDELFKIYIKIKEQQEIVNVDDDEENSNEEISLQNDEYDDNIDLERVD